MKVAFFGSYLFLVPVLLKRFEFVDIYVERKSYASESLRQYYERKIASSEKAKLFIVPENGPIILPHQRYDLGFAASFGRIFKSNDIAKFKYLFNLHPGPISLARGRHPLPCAIKFNHQFVGITIHQITNEDIDAGPILFETKIAKQDQPYKIMDLMIQELALATFQIALKLVIDTFPNITLTPNGATDDTYYPPLSNSDLVKIMNS